MFKKILSLLLILALVITAIPTTGLAQTSSTLNGNPCKVINNNKLEKVVQGDYKGERLTARFDKNTREITMEVTNLNTTKSLFAFSKDISKKTYTVDVNNLNTDNIDAKIIDNDTKKVIEIKNNSRSPVLRTGVELSILIILGEFALKLLTVGLVIYIANDAYVNFKDCANELARRNVRQYYTCVVQPGNDVFIGPGISYSVAVDRLQRGLSIFAINKSLADVAATNAGNGSAIGPEKGAGPGEQYWHYHVRMYPNNSVLRLPGSHSFYPL